MQDFDKLEKLIGDYSLFLKQFAQMTECKEVNRVREFVIAVDTSGSQDGELAEIFLRKTYNILKSTEIFASKINLHIIQCDSAIQEDAKITCQEEFEEYVRQMSLVGTGRTDFIPVFNYVNEMLAKKEFSNFECLIYFTDGFGTFPTEKPDYNVAFVFASEQYKIPSIPSWVTKLVMNKKDI